MDYRAVIEGILSESGLSADENGKLPGVDSLEVMNLVSELEEKIGMMIPGDELQPENFESVDSIVALLSRITSES